MMQGRPALMLACCGGSLARCAKRAQLIPFADLVSLLCVYLPALCRLPRCAPS